MTRITEILTPAHAEDVIILGRQLVDECGPHLPFDVNWSREWLKAVLKDSERSLANVFLAYKDDEPVGFLIGFARPYMFSSAILASQEIWYVQPEHRSGRLAYKLMKAFEEWARMRGAIEIFTGVVHDDPEQRKSIGGVLKRMGYPVVGTYHKKRTV